MILDCDACLARLEDRPKYFRSKVGLSEINGEIYIILINSKSKEKFKIDNIKRLHNSTIVFSNPDLNLMIKNADPIMLKLLFTHIKKIINGEKLHKLPDFNQIKNEKPKITFLHQIGNNFDLSIFKNSQLNKLTIERAYLVIPTQIWNLNHLTELNLIDCNLESIPERLCRLGKTLKLLNLSNNKLNRIDKLFFAKMPKLVSLNLSNNQIKFLPLDIVLSRSLITINLNNNRLTNLPYTIIYLKNLAELNISNNQIKIFSSSIWTSISNKLKLNKLDISNNYSPELLNQLFNDNQKFNDFKIPTLKQFASNSVVRKLQLFCNLNDYLPLFINDEIEEQTDMCSNCKKPYSNSIFFIKTHQLPIYQLASNGSVLNEYQNIWLTMNLCPLCKFNKKFKKIL